MILPEEASESRSPRKRRALAGFGAVGLAAAFGALLGAAAPATAADKVLNLYSSRHYDTDEALYSGFTAATGIAINRLDGNADELIERIKAEGDLSPADVLLTVDAGRLWRAEEAGVLAPVKSEVLESKVPASLRHPDDLWFGFSTRARVIFYSKERLSDDDLAHLKTYEDLADPRWKGRVCVRSSSNVYQLSLLASMIASDGEEKALDWAKAVSGNFARPPRGGDTDQIKGVAAGECDVALGNTYYYVRLEVSDKAEERAVAEAVGLIFPNQEGRGTHINVSGAGMVKTAPHPEAAQAFLEYLTSESAQEYFASGNNEYPVVAGVAATAAVQQLGAFKSDALNVSAYGRNQPLAQKLYDRAGWP